jgi:hypothetical protein
MAPEEASVPAIAASACGTANRAIGAELSLADRRRAPGIVQATTRRSAARAASVSVGAVAVLSIAAGPADTPGASERLVAIECRFVRRQNPRRDVARAAGGSAPGATGAAPLGVEAGRSHSVSSLAAGAPRAPDGPV